MVTEADIAAVQPPCRDPKDTQFLALCKACDADALISSDADLLVLHPWQGLADPDACGVPGGGRRQNGPPRFSQDSCAVFEFRAEQRSHPASMRTTMPALPENRNPP